MSLDRAHCQTEVEPRIEMYRTKLEAQRALGYRTAIMECWHWCSKCGSYWCHYVPVTFALDPFVKVCYGSSRHCLSNTPPKPTDRYADRPVVQDGVVRSIHSVRRY